MVTTYIYLDKESNIYAENLKELAKKTGFTYMGIKDRYERGLVVRIAYTVSLVV